MSSCSLSLFSPLSPSLSRFFSSFLFLLLSLFSHSAMSRHIAPFSFNNFSRTVWFLKFPFIPNPFSTELPLSVFFAEKISRALKGVRFCQLRMLRSLANCGVTESLLGQSRVIELSLKGIVRFVYYL